MRIRWSLIFAFLALLAACMPAVAEVYAINYAGGAVAVDKTGAVLIPAGKYDELYALFDDNGSHTGYAAGLYKGDSIMYAVLDSTGRALTEHIYSEVRQAGNGCIVCENGAYKYLNSAHMYDDMEFSDMAYSGDGRVLAVVGNIYDDIGDTVTILWPDGIYFQTGIRILGGLGRFSEGLMPVYDSETRLYGYINNQGSWVISPAFKYAGDFSEGLAVIAGDDGYGVIDRSGTIKLAPSSPRFTRTDTMFAMIRSGSLRVYDGELTPKSVTALADGSARISGNYIILYSGDDVSVMRMDGEKLFSANSEAQISSVGAELFAVRQGKWMDECVSLVASDGSAISDGYVDLYALGNSGIAYAALTENSDLSYGLMDQNGIRLTEALYSSMAYVADGLYIAYSPTGAVLLDREGNILNTFKSDRLPPVD